MNPTDQRTHRTVTQQLEQRLDGLEDHLLQSVTAMYDRVNRDRSQLEQTLREVRNDQILLRAEVGQIEDDLDELDRGVHHFLQRSCWGRVRWIVTGR